MAARAAVLALVLVAVLGCAGQAAASGDGGAARRLLQDGSSPPAGDQSQGTGQDQGQQGSGPQTQVLANVNTLGQAVACINATQPAEGTTHGAKGGVTPDQASVQPLLDTLCANSTNGEFYAAFKAGGGEADKAAYALKTASCPDQVEYVLNGVVSAAQMLAQSVSEVESFLNNFVNAFRNVGAPSCLTLLVGDGAGNVVSEKYFAT